MIKHRVEAKATGSAQSRKLTSLNVNLRAITCSQPARAEIVISDLDKDVYSDYMVWWWHSGCRQPGTSSPPSNKPTSPPQRELSVHFAEARK